MASFMCGYSFFLFFFFFKQKTAYEMRISDWSSDVCSSDLLEEIAFHVAPGAHAVLLLDQAGWHGSAELVVPPNITLMPLPPRCPELNPVENVWQFMRDNWLSNRIFQSYDDIVDHCRSEEHTSELQSLMRISYAVFCLKKKKNKTRHKQRT